MMIFHFHLITIARHHHIITLVFLVFIYINISLDPVKQTLITVSNVQKHVNSKYLPNSTSTDTYINGPDARPTMGVYVDFQLMIVHVEWDQGRRCMVNDVPEEYYVEATIIEAVCL